MITCLIAVVSQWSVIDPKIAAWLLDADHPVITFNQAWKFFMDLEVKFGFLGFNT